ncbi:MAG: AAA family ATPase [Rhodoferax sp.]|nr:AAA family ATPase [Rhodoferax sp.]
MLKTLHIRQFTVFQDARFEFSPGLNVIIGDNGTGKTHVLKLGYLFSRAWPDLMAKQLRLINKDRAQAYLSDRLAGLFRVSDLGLLVRQGQKSSAWLVAEVSGHIPTVQIHTPAEALFKSPGMPESMPWDIHIQRNKDASGSLKASVVPDVVPDTAAINAFLPRQVFVPSKEMVSLFKGLIGLFDRYREFPLDETYRDLAVDMSTLEPRLASSLLPDVMQRIQKLLGGDLKLDSGDLVFERSDGSRLESHLLAEGHRKLAMLIYLLRYGVIERGSTLFWDEPEANLNPAAIKLLAEALFVLTGLGVQVILATHSLFLLREFEILQLVDKGTERPSPRYFGLGVQRRQSVVSQGNDITSIDPLLLLDENLHQSDRFMEASQ